MVWWAASARIPSGTAPTWTDVGACPQPDVTTELQLAASTTETVLSSMFATYSVPVAGSRAIALGSSPTPMVGQGPAQPVKSCARQRRVSMTDTVFPKTSGPFVLLPL